MRSRKHNPCADLERIFHEPGRLAIMSALCGVAEGMSFTELKRTCEMTDGNLNRHLHVLREAGAVRLHKGYAGLRPRTTVWVTEGGRGQFLEYLRVLEAVLQRARERTEEDEAEDVTPVALDGAYP